MSRYNITSSLWLENPFLLISSPTKLPKFLTKGKDYHAFDLLASDSSLYHRNYIMWLETQNKLKAFVKSMKLYPVCSSRLFSPLFSMVRLSYYFMENSSIVYLVLTKILLKCAPYVTFVVQPTFLTQMGNKIFKLLHISFWNTAKHNP